MVDNLNKRHPQDASRINVHEDWEVRYWTGKWNVSRQQLMDTVRRVGVQVSDVAKALGKDR
ncbi:DUF3606 domain-containing protein [Microvirga sp. 17 mud 1-3]|uniref:DUF3606 domain-containing protein n=1 Tax=Microvirga sp. 17 mud 1-3 TaxID=2082949 RepID=UPI000D6ABE8A|nr:DUF3606 domain-containing protein [Microvirga sp. 17 mud 1-3]AWM88319.1 DUF3606 domain-containing protein [Microvirga sp. 17 mud 1-3]